MHIKYCALPQTDALGVPTTTVLTPESREKLAYPLLPKISSFVDSLRPDPGKIYTLISALGATEYWGQNRNGDIFYEDALSHPGLDYGYRTFLRALNFLHHKNKHPSLAIGKIFASEWHPEMKRVELVVGVARDLARLRGGERVVEKLDRGESPPVSMGCRVMWDRCSICCDIDKFEHAKSTFDPRIHRTIANAVLAFHRRDPIRGIAPTTNDYCECIRLRKNKILPDGRQVGMINDYPNFFDLSWVFVGADRTSRALLSNLLEHVKPAGGRKIFDMSPKPAIDDEDGVEKTASVEISPFIKYALMGGSYVDKSAASDKEADIVKQVASTFNEKTLPVLTQEEDDIDPKRLDDLGSQGLNPVLSTLSGLGIVLKPPEFQRFYLACHGRSQLADRLQQLGTCFKPTTGVHRPVDLNPEHITESLASSLMDLVPSRSFHSPFLIRRAVIIGIRTPKQDNSVRESNQFLDKMGSAYNNYRQQLLENMGQLANRAQGMDSLGLPSEVRNPGALSTIYVVRAHEPKIEDEEGLMAFIKEHPWLTASVVVPAMLALKRRLSK